MILLIQAYIILAAVAAVFVVEAPLARAVRERLADLADRLFTRRTLRIAAALLTIALIAALASRQPALIGMVGVSDVAFYLDAAIIGLALSAADLIRTAVEHLVRLKPWRRSRTGRASGARRRRTAKTSAPSSSEPGEDEPAWLAALQTLRDAFSSMPDRPSLACSFAAT